MSKREPTGAEVRVYRHTVTSNFSILSNSLLRNRGEVKLSAVARCVLFHLLSLPEGWKTNRERLAEDFTEGRDRVGDGINELIEHGFLSRKRTNDPTTGRLAWVWDVSDQPFSFGQVKPIDGNSVNGDCGPVDNFQTRRSSPLTESQSMAEVHGQETRRSSPSTENPAMVNQTTATLIYENEVNEGMTAAANTTPDNGTDWALRLVAELNYGVHRRPTPRQAAELADLIRAAHTNHRLSLPEIRRHCRAALNAAKRSGVPYLQGALDPARLPVPMPTDPESNTEARAAGSAAKLVPVSADAFVESGSKFIPSRLRNGSTRPFSGTGVDQS